MKLEISEDTAEYCLVDGIEDTDSYISGDVVEFGEIAYLQKPGEEIIEADIEEDGCCDGFARQGSKRIPLSFELGCDFEAEGDED